MVTSSGHLATNVGSDTNPGSPRAPSHTSGSHARVGPVIDTHRRMDEFADASRARIQRDHLALTKTSETKRLMTKQLEVGDHLILTLPGLPLELTVTKVVTAEPDGVPNVSYAEVRAPLTAEIGRDLRLALVRCSYDKQPPVLDDEGRRWVVDDFEFFESGGAGWPASYEAILVARE